MGEGLPEYFGEGLIAWLHPAYLGEGIIAWLLPAYLGERLIAWLLPVYLGEGLIVWLLPDYLGDWLTAGPSRSGQGEGLTVGVLPVLETLFVLGEAVVRLGAHGLGQVPEGSRVVQVQLLLPQHKTHALLPQNALL